MLLINFTYVGGKISKMEANNNTVKMIDPTGKSIDLNEESEQFLSLSNKKMWHHFKQVN